jgi:hypothetical protein
MTSAACFFPACYPSPAGNGDDEEYAVAAFAGRDEGAGDLIVGRRRYRRFVSKHGLSMQWRRRLANPCYHLILHWKQCLANLRRDDVSLLRVSFNSTLESLPLQLYSQPLTDNSFAIDRLGNLFLFPVLLILSLPLFFLEMMTTLVMFGWRYLY